MIAYGYGKLVVVKMAIFSMDPSWDPSTLALDKVKYQPVSAGLDTRSGTVTWPKMQFLMRCCGPTELRMVAVATQLFWIFTPKIFGKMFTHFDLRIFFQMGGWFNQMNGVGDKLLISL